MSNPYIDGENYAEGYQQKVEELKNKPEVIMLDKLCFAIFHGTEDGVALMKLIEERFLLPALCHPNSPNYNNECMFYEGFKEAFRMVKGSGMAHEQRIKAEDAK